MAESSGKVAVDMTGVRRCDTAGAYAVLHAVGGRQDVSVESRDNHKRLLSLKTNQRLLRHQGEQLREAVRAERLEQHLKKVHDKLRGSWTTVGIHQAILQFFRTVEGDLVALGHEAETANRMVAAIYRRHNEENPLNALDAPQFRVQRYLRDLAQLQEKADRFRLHLKTLLTELVSEPKGTAEWSAKLSVLKENVEHHIEEEEGELFTKAKRVLARDDAEAIAETIEAFKEEHTEMSAEG